MHTTPQRKVHLLTVQQSNLTLYWVYRGQKLSQESGLNIPTNAKQKQ